MVESLSQNEVDILSFQYLEAQVPFMYQAKS
jgi:hypothetical protein